MDSAAVVLEAAASRAPVWAFAAAPVWASAAVPLAAVAFTMRLAQGSAGAVPAGAVPAGAAPAGEVVLAGEVALAGEVVLAGLGDPGGAPAPGGPDGAVAGVVVVGLDGVDGDGVGVGRSVPVSSPLAPGVTTTGMTISAWPGTDMPG